MCAFVSSTEAIQKSYFQRLPKLCRDTERSKYVKVTGQRFTLSKLDATHTYIYIQMYICTCIYSLRLDRGSPGGQLDLETGLQQHSRVKPWRKILKLCPNGDQIIQEYAFLCRYLCICWAYIIEAVERSATPRSTSCSLCRAKVLIDSWIVWEQRNRTPLDSNPMHLVGSYAYQKFRVNDIEWHRDSRGNPTVESVQRFFTASSGSIVSLTWWWAQAQFGTNHTQSSWSSGILRCKEADELDIVQRLEREIQGPNKNVWMFLSSESWWGHNFPLDKGSIFPGGDGWATIWVRKDLVTEWIALFLKQTADRCRHLDFVLSCLLRPSWLCATPVQAWNSSSASG